MRGIISEKDFEIEYYIFGQGFKIVFAFPGFNNHAESLSALAESLGQDFKIIAVNLFFHGTSKAEDELVNMGLSIEAFRNLFESFMRLFPAEKYWLVGYSLGGRFTLKITEQFPGKIERLILLAPDGMRFKPLYYFITHYSFGRRLFRYVVYHPGLFFSMARLLKRFGIVDRKRFEFAMGNFDQLIKREMVYKVWLSLRHIEVKINPVKAQIQEHKIITDLFFGRYDRIIPVKSGLRFQRKKSELISLHVLNAGHKLLRENVLKEVGKQLLYRNSTAQDRP